MTKPSITGLFTLSATERRWLVVVLSIFLLGILSRTLHLRTSTEKQADVEEGLFSTSN